MRSRYYESNQLKKTKYFAAGYEKEVTPAGTREINYINTPYGTLAAYIKENNNTGQMYYLYKDHLGSITNITNSTGTVVERRSFDAWGRSRNPDNWGYNNIPAWTTLNRGHTGHEHLFGFDLINMNGRMYDPIIARMLAPDKYVPNAANSQDYNRYSYARNNPLRYTDPSGDFLRAAMFALTFLRELTDDNSLKQSWKNAQTFVNELSEITQFTVYKNDNTVITAGYDPFSIGLSANIRHRTNTGTTLQGGVGLGFLGGFNGQAGLSQQFGRINIGAGIGGGTNHWGWNASLMYDDYGLGYGWTSYGGEHAQTTGTGTAYWKGGSFRLENDFLRFNSQDRWRTSAWELQVGDFVMGSSVYTNDPKGEAAKAGISREQATDMDGLNLSGQTNKHGNGAWKEGQVYSSPIWIGFRNGNNIIRTGFSDRRVQDRTQNWVHRNLGIGDRINIGYQNYYNRYDYFYEGPYGYSGYYNPFSLY
jgi:RHS repeat-associated protein